MKEQEIEKLVRPNIKALVPYEAARHLMNEPAVLLDANENPFESDVNRYPDPWQRDLKKRLGEIKYVQPNQIFIGNGSDEIIDLLIRIFCEPGRDKIITTPPTYGMYQVSAGINNVEVVESVLNDDYTLNVQDVLSKASDTTKIIFLCTPNNPTGNLLNPLEIEKILIQFKGIVVVDEAYIDFADAQSWAGRLTDYPNLVVMQTLSKAYGLAGVRLGITFCSLYIMALLNKVKPPYNISSPNQQAALNALKNTDKVDEEIKIILQERTKVAAAFNKLTITEKVYPSDANFLLVKVKEADQVFEFLKKEGIVVRSRSRVIKCEGSLRITIGTKAENDLLLSKLKEYEKTTSPVH